MEENFDINLSDYNDDELKMHYRLCLTTLNHFKKIMEENPVLGEQERTAVTVCLTEAQNDVNECEAEIERRNITVESESE